MGKRPKGPIHISTKAVYRVLKNMYLSSIPCFYCTKDDPPKSDIVSEDIVDKIMSSSGYGNRRSGHNLKAGKFYPNPKHKEFKKRIPGRCNPQGKLILEVDYGDGDISSCVINQFPFEIPKLPKGEVYISPINVNIYSKNRIKFTYSFS